MPRIPKPWFRADRKVWQVTIAGKRINLGPEKKQAFEKFHQLMKDSYASQLDSTDNLGEASANARPAPTRQHPEPKSKSPQLFSIVADEFLGWVLNNRGKPTFEWYRYRLERFCQMYPELYIDDIKPFQVQRWVDRYPKLRKTTKRNYMRSVKRCVQWAIQQGYLKANPLSSLEIPGSERREVALSNSDFERMMENIPDPTLRDLCLVAYQTGCRPQEILRLEKRHFDEKNSRWVFPIVEAKGKRRPRVVYLTPEVLKITQELVRKAPEGKLFRNRQGRPWTVSAVNCAFARLQQRMGRIAMKKQQLELTPLLQKELDADPLFAGRKITTLTTAERRKLSNRAYSRLAPKYCLYSLRHAWATRALESGLDSLTVATLMGHSDPSMLARVYSHISSNPEHMAKQAVRAVGG